MTDTANGTTPTDLYLAWQNADGKVNAQFTVQVRHQTEPPSVPKYLVRVAGFNGARWSNTDCDNCGAEVETELPAHIQTQVLQLLGRTLYIPLAILDNKLTFYIDPPSF